MPQPGTPRRRSGELEAAVLAALWAAGAPLTPAAVRDALGGTLARNTVATVLSRLHRKGTVARARTGRAYAYTPIKDAAGLAAGRMHTELAGRGRDRHTVLARFVSQLSHDDEELLRRLLAGTGPGTAPH